MKIYTLSGVSNVGMVLTKENGFYPLIKRDKYGWHNQNSIYGIMKLLLLVELCGRWNVKSKENISSSLNKLGLRAINLGFKITHHFICTLFIVSTLMNLNQNIYSGIQMTICTNYKKV